MIKVNVRDGCILCIGDTSIGTISTREFATNDEHVELDTKDFNMLWYADGRLLVQVKVPK